VLKIAVPVPLRATVIGCVPAPALKVSSPCLTPGCEGVNVIATAQLAPAASELPQLVTFEKSPLTLRLSGVTMVPLLVTLTVCVALETPVTTTAFPNVTEVGDAAKLELTVLPPADSGGMVLPVSKTGTPWSSESVDASVEGAMLEE
jgi:hypothetical protein